MPPPRKVLLSSLTPGRCFTLPTPPPEPAESAGATSVRHAATSVTADRAFRVVGPRDGGIAVVTAEGKESVLGKDAEVVEIPREGYERLVERARTEPKKGAP